MAKGGGYIKYIYNWIYNRKIRKHRVLENKYSFKVNFFKQLFCEREKERASERERDISYLLSSVSLRKCSTFGFISAHY